MRAIVLAGGRGQRLSPLTDHLPKPLVPVLNYPILGHVLGALRAAGFRDVGVVIGPFAHAFRAFFGDGRRLGLTLTWIQEPQPGGTGGALRAAGPFFGGEPALVVTADMLSTVDLAAVARHHHAHPATVTVAAAPVDLARWRGDVLLADGPRGLAYQFKPGPTRALSNLGSCGVWVVDPAILPSLPGTPYVDFSSQVLPRLPDHRHTLGVYHAGPVRLHDFGEFPDYHQGVLDALQGAWDLPIPGTQALPGVWAEAGCQLSPRAHLHPPLALGRNVTVHPGARLQGPAVIGHDATIGPGAAVIHAVILPGARLPAGSLTANGTSGHPRRALPAILRHPMPTPHGP